MNIRSMGPISEVNSVSYHLSHNIATTWKTQSDISNVIVGLTPGESHEIELWDTHLCLIIGQVEIFYI